jgi:hypothetical protein
MTSKILKAVWKLSQTAFNIKSLKKQKGLTKQNAPVFNYPNHQNGHQKELEGNKGKQKEHDFFGILSHGQRILS